MSNDVREFTNNLQFLLDIVDPHYIGVIKDEININENQEYTFPHDVYDIVINDGTQKVILIIILLIM